MAKIKSFTSLEQSRKLAEFLPIESADMYYYKYGLPHFIEGQGDYESIRTDKYHDYVPCWSLAALLDVLPTGKVLLHDKGNHGYKCICNNIDSYYFSNPVDACVAMILKLHELKKL